MTDHSSDPHSWIRVSSPRREPIRESEWRADRDWRLAWQQRERERRRQNERPVWIVMGLWALVALYGILASPEVDHPPDAAPAFVSEADKVYFAAPCIVHWDGPWDDLRLRTFGYARARTLELYDMAECDPRWYHYPMIGTWAEFLLIKWGLLSSPPRWWHTPWYLDQAFRFAAETSDPVEP